MVSKLEGRWVVGWGSLCGCGRARLNDGWICFIPLIMYLNASPHASQCEPSCDSVWPEPAYFGPSCSPLLQYWLAAWVQCVAQCLFSIRIGRGRGESRLAPNGQCFRTFFGSGSCVDVAMSHYARETWVSMLGCVSHQRQAAFCNSCSSTQKYNLLTSVSNKDIEAKGPARASAAAS
eukprot:103206-Pelagomonas_calceolata.AAC.2